MSHSFNPNTVRESMMKHVPTELLGQVSPEALSACCDTAAKVLNTPAPAKTGPAR